MNLLMKQSIRLANRLIRLTKSCAWWNRCDHALEAAIREEFPNFTDGMIKLIVKKFNAFYDDTNGGMVSHHTIIEITRDEVYKVLWMYNIFEGKYTVLMQKSMTFEQAHSENAISDETYALIASDRHLHLVKEKGVIVSWVKKRAQLSDFYIPGQDNSIVSVLN